MNKIQLLFLSAFAGIMLFGSSCVRDGEEACPSYLRIVYDYNMEYTDLFHREVSFLSIFMFDAETGVLVREVKQAQDPFPEDYTFRVPAEWIGDNYDIVAWAGLDPDSYEFPTLTPGVSTIHDFQLRVKDYENQVVNRTTALEPLWHGKLENVSFSGQEEIHTVSLRKDTRKFRLVVQSIDEDYVVESDHLDIRIHSSGGWYDNANRVLDPKDRGIVYHPYYTQDDPEVGAIAELNSMRLIDDGRENRLVIGNRESGKAILDISLMKYLNALRLLEHANLPFQEYLDREDEYYILVFLQKVPGGPEDGNWLAVQIEINQWIIRIQDID